ncbi:Rha family transcriptional regulator [Halomonas sp. 707B3]|uniref:Rha family transcriptional regulator n=1 Tax=Halomonas sp. 707B3 TaxID=1681043 RepID=UPI00209C922B|nr:Rha family transcriptional regulator [Halomonas sp. 707B3]MCP1316354.1 Rha family transcriptional regulator [Halomonas sp. 707B3]
MNTNTVLHSNPDSSAASMTSLEISELVEARHDSVKRAVERLATRAVITLPPLVEKPTSGRPSTYYVFEGEKGKRDSYVVVAQLCPEFTARLVDRWQELEGQTAKPAQLSRMEILQIALESEQARIAAESERDQAIATKAQISSSREASVMGKLSAASRKMQKLEQELGRNATEATMTAVEKAMSKKFGGQGFRPLKKWCTDNGVTPSKVPCPRYGEVVAWPAQAWLECYGVDLSELFGREDAA